MLLDSVRAKFPTQEQRDEFLQEARKYEEDYLRQMGRYDLVVQLARGLGLLTGGAAAATAYRKGRRDLALGLLIATPTFAGTLRGIAKGIVEPREEKTHHDFMWKVYNLAKEKGAEKVVVPTGKVKVE